MSREDDVNPQVWPEVCTVAVDVGNTAVKLALRQGDHVINHAIKHDHTHWHIEAVDWVRGQLACRQTRWRVSSVHRHAAETLIEAIGGEANPAAVECVTFREVPLKIAVDSPMRLGIDRLLSAFAATRLVPSDARSDGLVVIDAGSAITVDWISETGCFCGGAILPGLALQSRALATGTDALPEILWSPDRHVQLPGKNTNDAIHGGILVGAAGAIDSLIDRYFSEADDGASRSVVLTGGDATALSQYLRHSHQMHAHLVCRGLLELPAC